MFGGETGTRLDDAGRSFTLDTQAMIDRLLRGAHGVPGAEAGLPGVAEMNSHRALGNVIAAPSFSSLTVHGSSPIERAFMPPARGCSTRWSPTARQTFGLRDPMALRLYEDYTREAAHDLFAPTSPFTPGAAHVRGAVRTRKTG